MAEEKRNGNIKNNTFESAAEEYERIFGEKEDISLKLIRNRRVAEGLKYVLIGPVKYFLLGCMFKIYGMLGKENSIIKKRSISLQDEVKEEAMTDLLKSIGS